MKAYRNYFLLCIIAFLQGFIFYGPVATVYRQSRGISIYEIFLIESIFMILMVVFELPWGWFADRFGYKTTLVSALFLNFISKIIFYKAFSFEWFLMERVLLALALSGVSGCDTAFLYNSAGKDHSEKAFSRYYALSTFGFLLAASASTLIVSVSIDLTALLTIIPFGLSVAAALFLQDIEGEGGERPNIAGSLKKVVNSRQLLLFVIAAALLSEVAHSVTVFLNQLQYQRSGIGVKHFGIIMAAIQVLTMLSAQTHVITKAIGKGKTVNTMAALICVSTLLLIFTNNPVLSVLLVAVVGLCNAVVLPISSDIQNKSISTADRATILSAYAMTIDIVSAFINLAVGKTANQSVQLSFAVCSVLAAAALVLSISFFRSVHAGKPEGRNYIE